jgi:predicted outer membrane repeat protein
MICLPGGSVSAAPAHICSAAITVANANDSGTGSLRDAIANICAGGTITFGGDTTITLTSPSLFVNKSMTIDGAGHSVTIGGGNTFGVFFVTSGVTGGLNHLTITDGNALEGGGIFNDGMLTVQNSTFSGNSAPSVAGGGIYNYGTLTVQNSTFSDNSTIAEGGGIFNDGTLTVQNSTFSGNSASFDGGGIFNDGTLNLSNTIIANSGAAGD